MTPGQRNQPRVRPLAGAVRLLLALLFAVSGLVVHAPAAHADEPDPGQQVQLTITSITPSGTDGKGTLTIQGTARNTTDKPIEGAQVYLWRSTDAITDQQTLDDVLASEPANPVGARMYRGESNFTELPSGATDAGTALAPGQSVPFTVSGAIDGPNSLGFATRPAAYLVGLQVKVGAQRGVFGRARALFTVADANSVRAAQVVVLSSRPSRVAGNRFIDNHLAEELTGRLQSLLDAASMPGSTVLVDPALHDDLSRMASGYTVNGAAQPAGQAAAKAFLTKLSTVVSNHDCYRLPTGDPDVAVALRTGHPELLQAATTLPADHALAGLPLAVWPRDGRADDDLVAQLASFRPAFVLLDRTSASAPVQTAHGVTVVRYDSTAFAGGPGPDPRATTAQLVGRLQAQQAVAAAGGDALVSVVTTAAEAGSVRSAAPWRSLVDVKGLVGATPAPVTARPTLAVTDDPGRWTGVLDSVLDEISVWGELTGQANAATLATGQLAPQVISRGWDSPVAATRWSQAVRKEFGSVLQGNQVTLSMTRTIVTSAPTQEVPVTVTNKLSTPVKVRVAFTSDNPQRVDIATTPVATVPAGGTETIRVQVRSKANGPVGVSGRLETASGRPIGNPSKTTVTVTQMGRVGWLIIVGSGAVVLGATAIRIRQVQHERRLGIARRSGMLDPTATVRK